MKLEDIVYIARAHSDKPVKPSKAVRKWDGKTPFYVHPLWCAATLASEERLDERIRGEGTQALLYHDVLEDTTAVLPDHISARVRQLVQDMTYAGSADEMVRVWEKEPQIRLLKLYDKVSNLLDSRWMAEAKLQTYREYVNRLTQDVKNNYGDLNITAIAESLVK